jgi:transcription elongation factor Elf1
MSNDVAKIITKEKCVLSEPLECPHCGGHFKVDVTFIEQVEPYIHCMYCQKIVEIPDDIKYEE